MILRVSSKNRSRLSIFHRPAQKSNRYFHNTDPHTVVPRLVTGERVSSHVQKRATACGIAEKINKLTCVCVCVHCAYVYKYIYWRNVYIINRRVPTETNLIGEVIDLEV